MTKPNHTNRTTFDISSNPKLLLWDALIKDCYLGNKTHSTAISENNIETEKEDTQWCPRTFDGFACWDETPPSTTAVQQCPEIVIGFDPFRLAYKRCTENGTWYIAPEHNKPWTNYTNCVNMEDLSFRSIVNNIYVVGYSISVAALVLSIFIFLYFKSLQCTRIRIHIHLFTSFTFNNILWIIWYRTVANNADVVKNNEEWCQVLHVLTNYFMVTSYIWMFCEGLHLHIALVVVFVKDVIAMRWFIFLGWGLSLIIVGVYAIIRYHTPGVTDRCWMDQTDIFWIIIIPVLISLIASFVFLINVVRVLLAKLNPGQHASQAFTKATKATLILRIAWFEDSIRSHTWITDCPEHVSVTLTIPLFGLNFILIPLRPAADSPGEWVYQVFSALLVSLQGLCLAVLFCFTNNDVIAAAKVALARIIPQNDVIALTGITGGESLAQTRENAV